MEIFVVRKTFCAIKSSCTQFTSQHTVLFLENKPTVLNCDYRKLRFRTIVILLKWISLNLWHFPGAVRTMPPCTVPSRHLTQPCQQTLVQPEANRTRGTSGAPLLMLSTLIIFRHIQHFSETEGGTQGKGRGVKAMSGAAFSVIQTVTRDLLLDRLEGKEVAGSPGDLCLYEKKYATTQQTQNMI